MEIPYNSGNISVLYPVQNYNMARIKNVSPGQEHLAQSSVTILCILYKVYVGMYIIFSTSVLLSNSLCCRCLV